MFNEFYPNLTTNSLVFIILTITSTLRSPHLLVRILSLIVFLPPLTLVQLQPGPRLSLHELVMNPLCVLPWLPLPTSHAARQLTSRFPCQHIPPDPVASHPMDSTCMNVTCNLQYPESSSLPKASYGSVGELDIQLHFQGTSFGHVL